MTSILVMLIVAIRGLAMVVIDSCSPPLMAKIKGSSDLCHLAL